MRIPVEMVNGWLSRVSADEVCEVMIIERDGSADTRLWRRRNSLRLCGLAPVDGDDFYGVGDAFEGDFAGLGDVPFAVGGGVAADEDFAGAGEGADAGGPGRSEPRPYGLAIRKTG